ncbi:MAG TPA: hypothetical protein VFR10_13605, partial [bacterium]|nr:hypothetical protein [bacterium]
KALALISSNSALVAMPWLFPALASRPDGGKRLAIFSACIFVLLFLAIVPARSITGIHPGPRMLLPIVPIAAIGAARQAQQDARTPAAARGRLVLSSVLFLIGLAWSARSIALLVEKRETMGRIATELELDPHRVIATDLFWLPTELPALWRDKQFHLVADPSALRDLQARYAQAGVGELLFVTAAGAVRNRAPLGSVASNSFPQFSVELHVLHP